MTEQQGGDEPDFAAPGDASAAPSPVMPPLGPPYGPPPPTLPPPQYPAEPPEQWPATPLLWSTPPAPPSSPRSRIVQPALIAAIVTFVVVLIGAFIWSETGSSNLSLPRRTTTTAPAPDTDSSSSTDQSSSGRSTTTVPPQLNAVIDDIKAFVEKERGLKFKQDVPVKLAADDEFEQLVHQQVDQDGATYDELGQVLEPLGLVPNGTNVRDDERTLLDAGVVGFYDPRTKQLVVRGSDATPLVRRTIAHELTHALDDQWFGLDRPALDHADDESGFGFSALVEGNARRVENAYMQTLSVSDQRLETSEELQLLAQHPAVLTVPPLLVDRAQVAYTQGETLVEQLLAHGGQPRLDAAFGAPPTTSAQVLDPSLFLAGTGPIAVTAADPDGGAAVANRGVLGAYLLGKLLDRNGTASPDATAEWGGDQYVTWLDGARTCIKDTMVGTDAVATAHLGEALAVWARGAGTTVTQDAAGALEISACV